MKNASLEVLNLVFPSIKKENNLHTPTPLIHCLNENLFTKTDGGGDGYLSHKIKKGSKFFPQKPWSFLMTIMMANFCKIKHLITLQSGSVENTATNSSNYTEFESFYFRKKG